MANDTKPLKPGTAAESPSAFNHIEFVASGDLKPNPRNARTHSKKQIKQIAESIQKFGFNNPILVDDRYEVIAGHGRLQAAKNLGQGQVPVVRLSHLSDAEKRAYVLADNKIALNSGWDLELLSLELEELANLLPDVDLDLEITGFDTGEIDLILTDHEEPCPSLCKEDEVPSVLDVVIAKRGDIWQMGRHRVLCGDARDTGGVANLFADQTANLVITDPRTLDSVPPHYPDSARSDGEGGPNKCRTQQVALFVPAEMVK